MTNSVNILKDLDCLILIYARVAVILVARYSLPGSKSALSFKL